MTSPTNSAKAAARTAKESPVFRALARTGYVVVGILHLLIGAIAISIATGAGGAEADQSGALQQIQQTPVGGILLWAIAIGLTGLAIWQIAEATTERDSDSKKKWGRRAKLVGTAIVYLAIAGTAFTFAVGGRSDSSEASQSVSAQLLSNPAGVALLVVLGMAVAAIGVGFAFSGVTRRFEKELVLPSGPARSGVLAFGVIGFLAKGIAVVVTGVLFVVAAFTDNPQAAGGLDAALRALAALPSGVVVLWAVGIGLAVYGLFCIARARFAKM